MALVSPYWTLDFLLLTVSFWILLYRYFTRNFDYWRNRNVPYLTPEAFFGNFRDALLLKRTAAEHLTDLYNQMKTPFFGIFILDKPVLIVRDPELVKAVLVKDFDYFHDRTIHSDVKNEPLTAHMLFFSRNPDWRVTRAKLTPVFTTGKLKSMLGLINEVGEEMKKYIYKNCLTGECVDAKEIAARYATDVISTCAFGINAHSLDCPDGIFREAGRKMFDFRWKVAIAQTGHFFAPGMVKLFGLKMFDPEATTVLEKAFTRAVAEREKCTVKRNDLIDIIIHMKQQDDFCDKIQFEGVKVIAQAAQFFTAGFETTSSVIAFTLYELCLNQHIQDKLRKEIRACMQKHGNYTYESLQDMKYLHQCIQETLRKYPVLPFLDRKCMTDYKIPGTNVTIEKDTAVYIPMFGLHYDPEFFPNPQKYDPDRFCESNPHKYPAFAYIPFGEGPRNCIGERFGLLGSKAGLVHILSEFEVHKGKETPAMIEFETKSVIIASKVGTPMIFKKIPSQAA